jgi:hypothetical protein
LESGRQQNDASYEAGETSELQSSGKGAWEFEVSVSVFLPLGALFSLLASVMAFLITYNEYSRHYTEKRKAIRAALQTGFATLLFFFALSIIAGLLLEKMFSSH